MEFSGARHMFTKVLFIWQGYMIEKQFAYGNAYLSV